MVSLYSMNDAYYIRRALRLAARARGRTSPNPMVGAVIVKKDEVIAEGYHKKAGTPHAEALALEKAGDSAGGATLYVSLEPCCHTDKRTPPCTKKIISAGISRVVISMQDPNPKVSGKGVEELRAAGIEVISGVLEEEARVLNEFYIKYITTGKPFVILKTAMTLDGKIATPTGESKWITGEAARAEVHKLRGQVDAIMTAIGTVKADDPSLTCRSGRQKSQNRPLRIIIDPKLEISDEAKVLNIPPATVLVAKHNVNPAKRLDLENRGLFFVEHDNDRPDLQELMSGLAAKGITSILLEGGSSLNYYALESGIVDKVIFFIAPKIIGGRASFPSVGGRGFRPLGEAHRVVNTSIRRAGVDFIIEGYIAKQ